VQRAGPMPPKRGKGQSVSQRLTTVGGLWCTGPIWCATQELVFEEVLQWLLEAWGYIKEPPTPTTYTPRRHTSVVSMYHCATILYPSLRVFPSRSGVGAIISQKREGCSCEIERVVVILSETLALRSSIVELSSCDSHCSVVL
jgi:hypothetical protein